MPALCDLVDEWRSGTSRSQWSTLAVLLAVISVCFAVSLPFYSVMPVSTYFVWLVVGMLLLKYRQLLVLIVYTVGGALTLALVDGLADGEFGSARASGMLALVLGGALILYQSAQQRSGLPVPLGGAMLADLRDRLRRQGTVPPLPDGWQCQTAMLAAHEVGYAGDFMVARLDRDTARLEMVLVDVVGKGVAAGTDALHFAGALGGLIGALPPVALVEAANDFLFRQESDETFATAVHVLVDLRTGGYELHSAGHPPALVWRGATGEWTTDPARGTALGVAPRPELHHSTGVLAPGDALLFYTDGVVERGRRDIDDGIDWLRHTARDAVSTGFEGAARRILRQVPRGDDDRAVLLLSRDQA